MSLGHVLLEHCQLLIINVVHTPSRKCLKFTALHKAHQKLYVREHIYNTYYKVIGQFLLKIDFKGPEMTLYE